MRTTVWVLSIGATLLGACGDSSSGGGGGGASECESQRQAILADAKKEAPSGRQDNPCTEPIVSGFEGRCADYAACAVKGSAGSNGGGGTKAYTKEDCAYIAEQIKTYASLNTDPSGNKSIPAGRQNNPCANPVPQAVFAACTKYVECKEATE